MSSILIQGGIFFKLEITVFISFFLRSSKVVHVISKKKKCYIALPLALHIHGLAHRSL